MADFTPLQKALPTFNPERDAEQIEASDMRHVNLTADDADTAGLNMIPEGAFRVSVIGVTNDANDWVTLPPLASVPNGHEITILCNAGSNFELRTPATSGELINTEDGDGTTEALCTDATIVKAIKVSTTDGWIVVGISATGTQAAINPD